LEARRSFAESIRTQSFDRTGNMIDTTGQPNQLAAHLVRIQRSAAAKWLRLRPQLLPLDRPEISRSLATLCRCNFEHRADLREDRADTGGDARHDGARGDSHKTGHQGIFNQILAMVVSPDLRPNQQVIPARKPLVQLCHRFHL
jgi:hypothetical protein